MVHSIKLCSIVVHSTACQPMFETMSLMLFYGCTGNSVDEYNHGFTERELDNPAYENFHDELSNSVT